MLKKSDPDIIRAYFEDNSGIKGKAKYVAFPESEKDVSEFLKEANEKKLPVTISGAGTGVAGGRVPFGGVVLATDKMNKILEIHKKPKSGQRPKGAQPPFGKSQKGSGASWDPSNFSDPDAFWDPGNFWDFGDGYAVVQPGVRIEELKREAEKEGLFYPPDPTEETAFIGGTVATNASGGRGFKYGSTRGYVRRLKVVLAEGQILEVKRGKIFADKNGWFKIELPGRTLHFPIPTYSMPKVKNSSGYFAEKGMDLIDLFIGAEGTLGVLTEIELALLEIKSDIIGILAFFLHDEDALSFVGQAKKITLENRTLLPPLPAGRRAPPLPLGGATQEGPGQNEEMERARKEMEALSLEYFDINSLELLRPDFPNIPQDAQAAIFFEQEITKDKEGDILNSWAKLLEAHNVSLTEVWFGDKEKEKKALRDFRHRFPDKVNEIVKRNKLSKVGSDIAVPDEKFDEMLEFYLKILKGQDIKYVIFGHIGESHLHVNMLPETCEEFSNAKKIYMKFVKKGISLGGTASAEHGIGKLKLRYLEAMYGKKGLEEMVRIKKALDPNCILCPGNITPTTSDAGPHDAGLEVMDIAIPYGKGFLRCGIPKGNLLGICDLKEVERCASARIVQGALEKARIEDMVSPKENVLIVVPDATREAHLKVVVPSLLDVLKRAGVSPKKIEILVATGLHRAPSKEGLEQLVGKGTLSSAKVSCHGQNKKELVRLGEGAKGVPIWLNKKLKQNDCVISVGVIEPHLYAGYSAGPKTIAIGLAGEETINSTHHPRFLDLPGTKLGSVMGNPFQKILWEIIESIDVRIAINVVNDKEGNLAGVFCGPLQSVYKEGVSFAEKLFKVKVNQRADAAILGVGHPKDINLYQASRAFNYLLNVPRPIVKKGGLVVLVASLDEGMGKGRAERRFAKAMREMKDPCSFLRKVKRCGCLAGEHRAYLVAKARTLAKLAVVTKSPHRLGKLPMPIFSQLNEALDFIYEIKGTNAKIYCVPHALTTIACLRKI